jgi:RNA polymerase sigma factor (sigma-70 family)
MGLVSTAVVERDDEALVADVRRGDDRSFEELYMRYRRRIAAYVQGMVGDSTRAEDITQDVFISALRRMRETDRPIAFKPWIYEIAKNACIDAYRRSRRAEEISLDADEGLAPADQTRLAGVGRSPESAVEGKQRLGDLCNAFGGLSETHHEILVLRELEGLSYRQIGERMGLSRPSVESTLFRARRRLTEEYDELASGRRCQCIQAMIDGASATPLGVRDQRRMARHLSWCQHCRRHARVAGLGHIDIGRGGLAARVAAFLPLPFLLRRVRAHGTDAAAASASPHAGASLAQLAAGIGPSVDQVGGFSKAAIVAVSLAVAGAGAGAATQATSTSISHHGSRATHAPVVSTPLAPSHRGTAGSRAAARRAPAQRMQAAPSRTRLGTSTTQRTPTHTTGGGTADTSGAPAKTSPVPSAPAHHLTLPVKVSVTPGRAHQPTTGGSVSTPHLPTLTVPKVSIDLSPQAAQTLDSTVTAVANTVQDTTNVVTGVLGGH